MGEKTEHERRRSAGYGQPNKAVEPSECTVSAEARREEEKQRAAKLAELRERKARLLEAKAQAARLAEAKERAATLAAKEEHEAHLEDGKQRGLRGFALVEHAAKMAETKKHEREAKLQVAHEERSKTNISDGQDQPASEVILPDKEERETKLQEPNEQNVEAHTAADSSGDRQEAKGCEEESQVEECEKESQVSQDEDGVDSADGDRHQPLNAQGCDSDLSVGFLHYKKTRAQVEQTEEQMAETERRKHQAEFVARQPAKTKSINRKGHHAFGRQKNRLATGSKS